MDELIIKWIDLTNKHLENLDSICTVQNERIKKLEGFIKILAGIVPRDLIE